MLTRSQFLSMGLGAVTLFLQFLPSVYGQDHNQPPNLVAHQSKVAVAPKPFDKLPSSYVFNRKTFLGSDSVLEDPIGAIDDVLELQLNWIERLNVLRGQCWRNFRLKKDTRALLTRSDFVFSYDPKRVKELHHYPKRGTEKKKELVESDFECLMGYIETPQMRVSALGYMRNGLDEITIKHASNKISPTRFEIHRMFFGFTEHPKDFFEKLKHSIKTEAFKFEVRRNRNLVELLVWRNHRKRTQGKRWVFDTAKGGVAIFHEDLFSSGACSTAETKFKEIDGVWLPSEFSKHVFDLRKRQWDRKIQVTFFNLSVSKQNCDSEFSISSLPVQNGNVPVVDRRTGRLQKTRFKDLVEK